jgi:biotin carboxylase
MIAALIARNRFKDELVVGDSNPSAGLKHDRHNDALVIDERPVTAAQIHNLILERVVTTNDRVLPGYVIARKRDRIVDGSPNCGSILYYPLKRLTRRRIHTKFSRHLTFQKLGLMMPRGKRLG